MWRLADVPPVWYCAFWISLFAGYCAFWTWRERR